MEKIISKTVYLVQYKIWKKPKRNGSEGEGSWHLVDQKTRSLKPGVTIEVRNV